MTPSLLLGQNPQILLFFFNASLSVFLKIEKLFEEKEYEILSGDEKLNFCQIVLGHQLFYSLE